MRTVKSWQILLRKLVESLSLEAFKTQIFGQIPEQLGFYSRACFDQEVGIDVIPSNLNFSLIYITKFSALLYSVFSFTLSFASGSVSDISWLHVLSHSETCE